MKKTRKILAILLAIIMTISVCLPTNAAESVLQKASSVVDAELQNILLSSKKDDEIPVDIWLYQPFSTQQLEKEIDSKIGLTKSKISQGDERSISAQKVDEYIETERALYSEKMDELYKDFLKDYSKVKALNETRNDKRLFFSKYSPLISAELTPAEIKQLAKDDRVQCIYYSPDVELVPESNISTVLTEAAFVRDEMEFTGAGIKIGLLEAAGFPNKNNSYFTANNIIYDPTLEVREDSHANKVAAIMVSKAATLYEVIYKGIVPDAKLYATYYRYSDSTDWRTRVEWLIDSGVDVINMSGNLKQTTNNVNNIVENGKYGTQERWVDHIALNHCVHFVKSAGNRGNEDAKITSPGMAYNIITVGAINDKGTLAQDDEIYNYSSYKEVGELVNKPDLVAPGEHITSAAGTASGTSLAAPHVTGIIAQLCQLQPTLKVEQETMKAILTASINPQDGAAYTPANEDYYDKFGAGVVNARESFMTTVYSRYTSSSFAAYTPSQVSHSYNINVYINLDPIRVSLSWLQYSDIPNADHVYPNVIDVGDFSDLSLKIYDPNGNEVASSDSHKNNTEIVEFDPSMGGNYTVKVTTGTITDQTTYYGLAWAFLDDGID